MLQPLNAVEALETTIVLSMAQPASDRTNVIAQGSDHVDEAAGPGMGRAGLLDVSSTLGTRQKRGVGGAPPLASKGFCACAGTRAVRPMQRRGVAEINAISFLTMLDYSGTTPMLTVEGGLRAAVLLVRLAHPIPRLHRGKRVGYKY